MHICKVHWKYVIWQVLLGWYLLHYASFVPWWECFDFRGIHIKPVQPAHIHTLQPPNSLLIYYVYLLGANSCVWRGPHSIHISHYEARCANDRIMSTLLYSLTHSPATSTNILLTKIITITFGFWQAWDSHCTDQSWSHVDVHIYHECSNIIADTWDPTVAVWIINSWKHSTVLLCI